MIRFDIITIFPDIIKPFVNESILKRAQENKKIKVNVHDLRDYTKDKHKKVDDRPFGGGPGMVMTPQPFFDCIKKVKGRRKVKVIMVCPTGKLLTQKKAKQLAKNKNLIILTGRYEGIDERVRSELVDESISIGDYILTGGELPALVLVDSISRLIPGVLGAEESLDCESFNGDLLEYPQYTRPQDFCGIKVPNVLLSGNHKMIKEWQKKQSEAVTKRNRPDLYKNYKK